MFLNQPMIVLLYKEAFLNTHELDPALPSSVVSLYQEFDDVFPDEMPDGKFSKRKDNSYVITPSLLGLESRI